MFEIVILGGGIAGLTIAEHCAKQTKKPILLLERYPNVGGRIVTNKDPQSYEIGAGRIHVQHHRVNALVKRFHLQTFPISAENNFEESPNKFYDMFEPIRNVLRTIPEKDLQTHTIAELLPKELHPLLAMFPYNAEFHKLRADIAIPLFANSENLGKEAEYYGIVGGMNQLTDGIRNELAKTHVEIRTRHRVNDVKQLSGGLFEITGQKGKKAEQTSFTIQAKKVVIATEYRSFKEFSVLKNKPFLQHITDSPLLRIYAVYPIVGNKAWFKDVSKTVTKSPLRHVIPIRPDSGLIMISYTEGDDTKFWQQKNDKELQDAIQDEAKKLFPDRVIPDPTYLKKHYWEQGCTYWKKGNYNIDETLLEAQNPEKNLYICGESVSRNQSWVESALESVEQLVLANRGL